MLPTTLHHTPLQFTTVSGVLIRASLCTYAPKLNRSISTTTSKKFILTQTSSPSHNIIQQNNLSKELPNAKGSSLITVLPEEEGDDTFLTKPAFAHPGFDSQLMRQIKFEHRPASTISDYIALGFMKALRHTFDFCTGYQEPRDTQHQIQIGNSAARMTVDKWLARFIVLESVAGIPGSVAGFLRHLHALRRFRRDKAWIETLLDEAYNERMHLLTFLKIGKPKLFTKVLLYVGQGIFCNFFFLAYLVHPKICHRFVGYLEEEAVSTYSRCISDMELGLCPDLYNIEVPNVAKEYWQMDDKSTFYNLIQYIRADEAKHREVNHTFANLKFNGVDRNPFALKLEDSENPQPSHTLKNHKAKGWERRDLIL